MLYVWGQFAFEVRPVNVDGYEERDLTEFAKKEILGIMPPREHTGMDDQEFTLQGKLYPNKLGGLEEMKRFKAMKDAGIPQLMMRGDGENLGWFSCTSLVKKGAYLRADGIAQVIAFEAHFFRQPVPDGKVYFSKLYQAQQK